MKRFERILENYCNDIGISPDQLISKDRHIDIDTARKAFWKVMNDRGLSQHLLARMFNRDVISVRRGISRISGYLELGDRSSIYYVGICERLAKWE